MQLTVSLVNHHDQGQSTHHPPYSHSDIYASPSQELIGLLINLLINDTISHSWYTHI
jgi:hypothetical protein